MPRFLLLRHAKATSASPEGDFARPLSPRGRRQAARLNRYLHDMGYIPDVVLVSPAVRTRETAEIAFAEIAFAEIHARPEIEFPPTLYDADAAQIWSLLRTARGASRMVIAHNPGIGDLALQLAGSNEAILKAIRNTGFPPCTLAVFETESDDTLALRLLALVTPEILKNQD